MSEWGKDCSGTQLRYSMCLPVNYFMAIKSKCSTDTAIVKLTNYFTTLTSFLFRPSLSLSLSLFGLSAKFSSLSTVATTQLAAAKQVACATRAARWLISNAKKWQTTKQAHAYAHSKPGMESAKYINLSEI